jgi:hypothetical protein
MWLLRYLNELTPFLHFFVILFLHFFCNYLPFEQDLAFYLNKFKFPLYLRTICTKFPWNWPSGSEKKKTFFKNSVYFHSYLPLERAVALHMNNFKSPIPKNDLCQLWLQLVQWFWKRSRKCKSLQTDDGKHAIRKAHSGELHMWYM